MNGGFLQYPTEPLHPTLHLSPFFNRRTVGTDVYAALTIKLHGYGNGHAEQKK